MRCNVTALIYLYKISSGLFDAGSSNIKNIDINKKDLIIK